MKRLVLVDGNALLHRAYHATPPLSTSKGELVNAVYGFTSMLLKSWEELKPDYLCVAWDVKAPTFRHEQFGEYKAKRKAMDEGLASQFERAHQVLEAFNIPEFKLPGFEADDLIGALTKQAMRKEKAMEIIIVTGDRDAMQLIDKRVKVFMPKRSLSDVGMIGEEEFALRYGFAPKNLVDFKALAGDQSDNIPGVAGIGEVTASRLIQQFGTVEKVYKNIKSLPEKLQRLLKSGEESAYLSKKLATLETEAPICLDLSSCRVHDFEREKVVKLFEELEFKSLIGRIPGMKESQMSQKSSSLVGSLKKAGQKNRGEGASGSSTTDLDHAVDPILQEMSRIGILVDLKFLNKLSKGLHSQLSKVEQEIYLKLGHQVNLNSPKQLQVVLFDELKLPVVKKTKTGRSTDEETLLQLQDHHPVVPLILKYRQLFKLISTYVDALPKYLGSDGRIHSTFNVEGATTGRITSENPNLQNIPIKGQIGSEIRKAFVTPRGKIFLGADYSQIELRILADLADDPGLKLAFKEGIDIHAATAAKIFGVPLNQVTRQQRMVGKTVNFATLYGQGPHALSRQLGVDYNTAKQYIEEYFAQFPKVKTWKEKILEKAKEKGYVETLWGRKRYIPELKATNHMMQAFGERAAVNHPIQGTAADMIKKAMVEIDEEMQNLKVKNQKCGMILQVHDELLFECNPKHVKEVAKMVKEKMENALKLSVPVVAEVKVGQNWGEMKPLVG